uniref:Focadhesin n=1 Tax=Maylandia zebra TaxID=106582 RepID=A0A3P9C1V1_9CICH
MMESLKTRLQFPSPVIQAQVRGSVTPPIRMIQMILPLSAEIPQGPALEALWQQCCSDCAVVCSACCDTLVLLVDQGHADLDYILNGVLNLLPSARHTQGLIKVIRRLLEMQADQSDGLFTCPYSIRSSPHPYVTALENREDCWPALLFEIDDFIQKAVDRDKEAYITMLAPFLRYLYCQPHRQPEHALLRQSLLRVLLPIQGGSRSAPQNEEQETLSPVSDRLLELSVSLSVLRKVANNPAAATDWLLAVSSALSSSQRLSSSLVLIVTYLIIMGQENICQLALKASQAVAAADPCQVDNPHNCSLKSLCFPIVLHSLHMLAGSPKLRAVGLRLMTALWKKQDRVYPELQRLMSQQDSRVVLGRDAQWEQILARAACVRDICRERPYQHAGDMVAAISLTLKQCNRPDLVTPAALVLQGLQELCRAEVVDIISAWRTVWPELSCHSQPEMVQAIAELLALVPQLTVKSEQYEVRRNVHVARPPAKLPENEEDEQSKEKEEDEKDLSVPGSSYVKLMTLTTSSVLPAFELFLTSLVRQEMSQMPRGIYFSALRGGNLRSDRGKTVAGIPSFMLKTYEKNKQPGLKPGLAAGLLLSYSLSVQTDRAGRPISRFLVSRSRSYQQTLTALVHEVNIQPSEWHRALLLPQAWRGFMSRAFYAVMEGRRAELEMLQKQGKEDPQELQYKHHCAWLWARDQLADVIKAATKDSPVVQGNAILALSGLAAVLAKYESNLPTDGDGSLGVRHQFVATGSWLTMVLDTLLSISSSSFKATGRVFPWFLHRSYSGENTASTIARSCASLALSLLVSVLVVWQRDSLTHILSALRAGLPGSPAADDSQAIQFHSGLGLGMVLSTLLHQRLSDESAQKDADLLFGPLDALEGSSFNPNLEYNTGCILGLGLVLSAFCSSGQRSRHVRVSLTLDKLLANLQDCSGRGRMEQEVLAYSVACVSVSAFSAGLIDAAKAEEVMDTLRSLTEESQQVTLCGFIDDPVSPDPGLLLALGLAVHGLSVCGHGKAEHIHPHLLAAWIKILLAEGCPTMQRLAAVNGLVALVGSESYLIQLKSETELVSKQHNRLNEVIRAVTQVRIVTFSGAIGLQSNSACLLGHLHLAHICSSHSHTAVPPDFSYLSEKSVVRSTTEFIAEAGHKGPQASHPGLVKTALTALASVGASFQYPPINWSAALSPLMRMSFGEDVQHQCVVLAACQTQSSHSAALFLGSWLSPPLVHSLSVIQYLLGLQQFQEDLRPQRASLCGSVLRGLAQAMALPNPSSSCWTILCSATEKIFTFLPDRIQDNEVDLYVGVAKCLSEMSDTEIERIMKVSEMEKTCFILAYLTSQGRVPLLSLNDVIAGVLRGWPSLSMLSSLFVTGISRRMEWLLQLMGHIRNVAYGVTDATDFLFQLFAAAVVSWGDHIMPLLFGIRVQWFPWQPAPKPQALTHGLYGEESSVDGALSQCLLAMSHSLPRLLDKEPWSSQTPKFIDWLLSIMEAPEQSVSASTVSTAKAALLALKSSAEFKKKAVWTRAYGW